MYPIRDNEKFAQEPSRPIAKPKQKNSVLDSFFKNRDTMAKKTNKNPPKISVLKAKSFLKIPPK